MGLFFDTSQRIKVHLLLVYPRVLCLTFFGFLSMSPGGPFAGLLSDVFPAVENLAGFCSGGYFEF